MLLFDGALLIAGSSVVALACLDRVAEVYGLHWLGTAVKLILPLAAMLAGVYFLEHNPLLAWLK